MIDAVVFDFDGTLVDSNRIKHDVFFEVVDSLQGSAALMNRILEEPVVHDRHSVFATFVKGLSQAINQDELVKQYTSICERKIAVVAEVPGATYAMEQLRLRGIELFINSATPSAPLTAIVANRYGDGFFRGVFGGPLSKEENLKLIISKYNFTPKEMLVVGDGDDDQRAAKAIGCQFVGVQGTGRTFKFPHLGCSSFPGPSS